MTSMTTAADIQQIIDGAHALGALIRRLSGRYSDEDITLNLDQIAATLTEGLVPDLLFTVADEAVCEDTASASDSITVEVVTVVDVLAA